MKELTSIRTKSIEKVRMNLTFSDNTNKTVTLQEGNVYNVKFINFSTNEIKEFNGKIITIAEIPLNGFIQSRVGKTYNLLFDPENDGIDGGQIWIDTRQIRDIDVIYCIPDDTGVSEEMVREAVNTYLAENPIEDGVVPIFSIGTVTTLTAGSQATVTVTGSSTNPVLNLGIPRGADGKDGATGEKGDQGEPGKDGQNGKDGVTPVFTIGTINTIEAGSQATATITGTATNPILNLNIPKGATGSAGKDGQNGKDGATGPAGANGNDGITPNFKIGTVTTLAAGSDVTVSITGTAENPVLNIGIPRGLDGKDGQNGKDGATGEKGDQGEPGKDGATGPAGANGNDGYTPVRGTDYWTATDIETIQNFCKAYIDEQISAVTTE